MNKIFLFQWAAADFEFVRVLSGGGGVSFYKFKHHPSWFSSRNYLRNFIYLARQFLVLRKCWSGTSIFFGNNLCRVGAFLPFSKRIFVFNEFPCTDNRSILFYLDRYILRTFQVFVSSPERAALISELYDVRRPEVLLNLPSGLDGRISPSDGEGMVYVGMVSSNRLNCLPSVGCLPTEIDVYGPMVNCGQLKSIFQYGGQVDSVTIPQLLARYRFGLLSYPCDDFNNAYAAPIKIYEYVHKGLIVISVNKNTGIMSLAHRYPGLIYFLGDVQSSRFWENVKFNSEMAEAFIADAERNVHEFDDFVRRF